MFSRMAPRLKTVSGKQEALAIERSHRILAGYNQTHLPSIKALGMDTSPLSYTHESEGAKGNSINVIGMYDSCNTLVFKVLSHYFY